MSNDLNDDLSDLLSGSFEPRPLPMPPAHFKPALERTQEDCPKCGGSGKFVGSIHGRTVGPCFKCKGTGKLTFKSSSADRAKGRAQAAARKANRAEDNLAAWQEQNPAEWAWMEATAPRWSLIASFIDGIRKFGSLTPRQMEVVLNGMAKDALRAEKKAERIANAPTADVTKIEQAFAVARQRAERPGMEGTFDKPLKLTAHGVSVAFRPGSIGSQWEGMLFAKSMDGKKLGHFKGGKFIAKFDCSPVEQEAVLACAADPETAVVAFAKAWKRCGVCSRTLLNDVSIARGIGPICAEKFGW